MTSRPIPRPSPFPTELGSEKLGPGRYVVWRRFVVGGEMHAKRLQCANPAYGYAQIGEWERALRAEARAKMEGQQA